MLANAVRWATHHRVPLTYVLVAMLLVEDVLEGATLHDPDTWSDPMGLAGGLLVLAGVLLRAWAAGVVRKNHALATAGPYSLTRHPLYVGSLLMGLGFSLLIGDDENLWAVLLLFALVYVPKVRGEERTLATLFGAQWAAYTRRTGMLFPRSWRLRLLAPWSLRVWRRNGEYWAALAALGGLIALDALAHPYAVAWLLWY